MVHSIKSQNSNFNSGEKMKKLLLFSLVIGVTLSVHAQNKKSGAKPIGQCRVIKHPNFKDRFKSEPAAVQLPAKGNPLAKKGPMHVATSPVSVIAMGSAGNAFGAYGNNRTYLWAEPQMNAISFSHRATTPSSGWLSYDFTKDGGANWDVNKGPVYITTGTPPNDHPLARYPQGAIYNPLNSVNPDSAYFTYFAPLRDTTNPGPSGGDWGGIGYGVYQFSEAIPRTQHRHASSKSDNIYHLIPDAFHSTQKGTLFGVEPSIPHLRGAYIDTMIISKGTFDPSKHDVNYTFTTMSVPLSTYDGPNGTGDKVMADQKVAFAPDGMTGYFSVLGHNDWNFKADSTYYPILYKTTDGGATWNGPINVPIDNLGLMQRGMVYTDDIGDTIKTYSTAFQHDLAVDVYGKPHIFTLVCPSTNNWSVPAEIGYMVDIYDSAGTWAANIVSNIQSYQGKYGADVGTNQALSEWNRGQISTTFDGKKIFYTWFDTDTTTYNGLGNTYCDMISAGMDVTTSARTLSKNFTYGSSAEASVAFGCVSYYVLEPAPNTYEIPVAYQFLNNNQTDKPVDFFYIKDATFANAEFTVGIADKANAEAFKLSSNVPNPFHNLTSFTLNLVKASNVTISVYNMLGQKIYDKNEGVLGAGEHNLTFDGSKLNAGIYFYSVKAGDKEVSRKMIID